MRRIPEFDALRGLAVLGVLLFHLAPNEGWTHFGMTGVHLFLVLSGFLIAGIVIREGGSPGFFGSFLARRALRIWPIYFATLLGLVVLQRLLPDPPSPAGLPYYLTFTQHIWQWPGLDRLLVAPAEPVRAFEHSWSLALEEQFYLLGPLAIVLVGRRRVGPLAVAVALFGIWFKTLGYDTYILWHHCGAFALGALIAAIVADPGRVGRHRVALSSFFAAAGLAGFGYVRWYYKGDASALPRSWMVWRDSLQNYGFYLIHFGIVGLAAVNAGSKLLAPLRLRELTFLGEISYGMYLYHIPVYWIMGGYYVRIDEPWGVGLGKVAATFVVATLSYRYVERPILGLKRFFPYPNGREAGDDDGPAGATPSAPVPPPSARARRPRMIHAGPRPDEADPIRV